MKPEEKYLVSEFMNKDVVAVGPTTTAKACAEVMAAERVSSAILTENSSIVGIITEKDLARKIVAKGLDANTALVKDIMTSNVVTIESTTSLYDAMVTFSSKKIKHLPVVDGNIVVGVITAMDILRVQPSFMELMASPTNE